MSNNRYPRLIKPYDENGDILPTFIKPSLSSPFSTLPNFTKTKPRHQRSILKLTETKTLKSNVYIIIGIVEYNQQLRQTENPSYAFISSGGSTQSVFQSPEISKRYSRCSAVIPKDGKSIKLN